MRDYHLLLVTCIWITIGATGGRGISTIRAFLKDLEHFTAAVFVVMQVVYESRLEEERKMFDSNNRVDNSTREAREFLPRSLLVRVDKAIVHRALDDIYSRRMGFVIIVAVATFVDEMIHGFGDMIYEAGRHAVEGCVEDTPYIWKYLTAILQ
jgi:hypothetical protein